MLGVLDSECSARQPPFSTATSRAEVDPARISKGTQGSQMATHTNRSCLLDEMRSSHVTQNDMWKRAEQYIAKFISLPINRIGNVSSCVL